ncbi:hypothetical protein BG000_002597 [Podila horticola]|nr:hypothetical protein BG000_002597 [Podila horticola]
MSGTPLPWTSGSTARNDRHPRKPYQSTVDQAREYAAACGPDSASVFDQLSHTTALVLRAYVAAMYQKDRSFSKIESIRDAMKEYFEDAFGCWGTGWQFVPDHDETKIEAEQDKDSEQGEWIGNPVFDKAFVDLMQELKAQDGKPEGTQEVKRRTSFGYEDMARLMIHLQKPETIEDEGLGRCLFFQALAATAFTLWLTFDEVLKLKREHFCFRRSASQGTPWFTVTVPFRNSNPANPSQANVYEIYPQLDEPHACCVTKVLAWLEWIDANQPHELSTDEFLFPQLAKDDHIQPQQSFSVSFLSNRLNKYAHDAGLLDHGINLLDKHCFRRGGAIHRLVHTREPWSFESVKWWGGWAEKESAEKIKEYLWAETQYESGFGDLLSRHGSKTHGVTGLTSQSLEVQLIRERFESAIQSLDLRHTVALAKIEKENQELRQKLAELGDTFTQQMEKVVFALTSRENADIHRPQLQLDPPQPQRVSAEPQPDLPEPSPELPQPPQDNRQPQRTPQPTPQLVLPQPVLPQPVQSQQIQPQPPRKRGRPKKVQEPSTPNQNARAPTITNWKEAIQLWEKSDPSIGVTIPLREWSASMRGEDQGYSDICTIAQEFEFQGRDEKKMQQAYGNLLDDGLHKLLLAICEVRQIRSVMEQNPAATIDEHVDKEAQNEEHTVSMDENQTWNEQVDSEKPSEEDNGVGATQPTVPIIPRCSDWKEVIRQWDEGDPENGLSIPLSRWPPEWSKCHQTYRLRKMIVTEFESFGRDESRMRSVYGRDMDGVWKFVQSIRARHSKRQGQPGAGQEGSQVQVELARDADGDNDDGDDEESRYGEVDEISGKRKHQTTVEGTDTIPAQTLPRIQHWRDAVKQWEEGDPDQGLTVPFRDWPAEMLVETYVQRNRNKRKMVAEEWEFFGRDVERMRQEHGANMDQFNLMLTSIKGRRKRQNNQEKLQELRKQTQGQPLAEEDRHQQAQEVQNGQQEEHQEQPEEEEDDQLVRVRKLLLEHKRQAPPNEAGSSGH